MEPPALTGPPTPALEPEDSSSTGWRSLFAETIKLTPAQADLGGAIRCTIGLAIPVVIGLATGAVADGLAASIGALCAGFASFQGAYRSRAAITTLVAVGMALATITGALAAHADWSAVAVIGFWALVAGMMTSLGQASLIIGLQWCVAVIIVNALPMTTTQAFVRGGMVLAGGMVQTFLVVIAWPIRSYPAERQAISALYRDLADFANRVADGNELGSSATLLDDARRALLDPQPFARAGQLLAFQALVDEAERMRIGLTSLARLRSGAVTAGGDVEPIERLAASAGAALRAVAASITSDDPPARLKEMSERIEIDTDSVCGLASAPGSETVPAWIVSEATRSAKALAGQLRSALRIAATSAGRPEPESFGDVPVPRHRARALSEALLTMRANLSWQSTVMRHALRLAVTLMIATLAYRVGGLHHGYWLALTALLVLRQDFTSTAVRGISRIAGTVVGAGAATILVAAIRPDNVSLGVMFTASASLAFLVVRVNYALFSICVTSYVVFLLSFARLPAPSVATDRLLDTVIGGALAIAVYLVWPTWESRLVGPQLATLLDAQAEYADGVLGVYEHPADERRGKLSDLRSRARLARSNAEASVERLAAEPARSHRESPIGVDQARGIVAAARRGSLALLTLHSHLPPVDGPELAALDGFTPSVTGRMRHVGAGLRVMVPHSSVETRAEGVLALVGHFAEDRRAHPPHPEGSLREAHGALVAELQGLSPEGISVPLLLSETDLLVDSVNTVAELVDGTSGSGGV